MTRRRVLGSLLALTLLIVAFAGAPAFAAAKTDPVTTCPVPVETQAQALARAMESAGIEALERFKDPLTQRRVLDAVDAIHTADILSDDDLETAEAYQAYMRDNLSAEGRDVLDTVLAEIGDRGIRPDELDERRDELTTPKTHPYWRGFDNESESLFLALPKGGAGGQELFGLGTITIIAIIACDAKIIACEIDVHGEYTDCYENRICEDGECANRECCADKAADDVLNCAITCGLNGPDGDYANCCE